jgi:hypothetical protein
VAVLAAVGFRLKAETTDPSRSFRLKAESTNPIGSFRLQAESRAHLKVSGTRFLTPDSQPFDWRGISAFRLVEFVGHGREREAEAYLAWAASKRLTVVRVLTMADVLFKLSPADGQHALPRLLDMAQKRGLQVEVVALADTAAIQVDIPRHVKAIGDICGRYPNALVEIANEPRHPTQVKAVHDPAFVKSLADLIPSGVPVALGFADSDAAHAAGTYVTWHAPRTRDWPAQIARGAALVAKFRKPVVNDEPMGAADTAVAGRRDNVPERFRQAAIASRKAGLGATFHYEGGLQAKLPTPKELACLDAWLEGLSAAK